MVNSIIGIKMGTWADKDFKNQKKDEIDFNVYIFVSTYPVYKLVDTSTF